jgi:hypothetical protein
MLKMLPVSRALPHFLHLVVYRSKVAPHGSNIISSPHGISARARARTSTRCPLALLFRDFSLHLRNQFFSFALSLCFSSARTLANVADEFVVRVRCSHWRLLHLRGWTNEAVCTRVRKDSGALCRNPRDRIIESIMILWSSEILARPSNNVIDDSSDGVYGILYLAEHSAIALYYRRLRFSLLLRHRSRYINMVSHARVISITV